MSKTLLSTASVAECCKRMNAAHREGIKSVCETATAYVLAGNELRKIKDGLKHGAFIPWIAENCEFSHRTANIYMSWSTTAEKLLAERSEINPTMLLKSDIRKALEEPKDSVEPKKKPPEDAPDEPAKDKPKGKPEKSPKASNTKARVDKTIADGKEVYGVLLNEIQRLRREVKRLSQTELGSHISLQRSDSGLVSTYQVIKFAMPFARCCYCAKPGGEQEGCRACKKRGWLSRGLHRDAPKKLRDMAAKGGGK